MSEKTPEDAGSPAAAPADTDADTDAAAAMPRDLDFAQARLAYSIIQTLLEHTTVLSDLVALMAQVIDEDTTRALTQTPNWAAYLESRRRMEATRADMEKFTEIMKRLDQAGKFHRRESSVGSRRLK
ncbi:MAG TPA: hypothetical protein VEY11_12030 [Pyrinomonadaceae bacterium]|nr:hypothetical protein [Pyrinomonadaceae bacterium]